MRKQLKLMIARKALIRKGSPESEAQAEKILQAVENSGGLTTEEVYALQVF